MFKRLSIALMVALCLVMNSVVAFAAPVNATEVNIPTKNNEVSNMENVMVIDFEDQSVRAMGDFIGTFNGDTCVINNVPDYGGYCLILLKNVPGKNITCTVSGNPYLHYRMEYLHSGFPEITYVGEGVLGDGSTTPVTKLGYTGNYYVSVCPYSGHTNAQKLTLTFRAW